MMIIRLFNFIYSTCFGFAEYFNVPRLASKIKFRTAFLLSTLTIIFLFMILAIELYSTLLISSLNPAFNITNYIAASSKKSLGIMLIIAVIGTPLVLGYTAFVYITFKGKIKIDETSY